MLRRLSEDGAGGTGKIVTLLHKLSRGLAVFAINTLIVVVCDNQRDVDDSPTW